MPDSLDPCLCGVDAMCQDSREAVIEKVCVNVHEHVSVQVLCVYMHAICLCACFVFHLCGLVRHLWGSHHHLGSHLAVKCDGRELGDGGGRQLVPLSGVFIPNKKGVCDSPKWPTERSQRGKESAFAIWVLNSTPMKIESAYWNMLLGIWHIESIIREILPKLWM